MKIVDDHVEVDETEASGGVKGHNVRYVLAFSLIAVVIVLSAIWIIPALLQPCSGATFRFPTLARSLTVRGTARRTRALT